MSTSFSSLTRLSFEPLSHWLIQRLGLSYSKAIILLSAIFNIPVIVAALIGGFWLNGNVKIGLLNDYGWWIYQLTVIPITFYYMFMLPTWTKETISKLESNGVVYLRGGDSEPAMHVFLEEFDKKSQHIILSVVSAIVVLLVVTLIFVPIHTQYLAWSNSNKLLLTYFEFVWFISYYAAGLVVLRVAIGVYWQVLLFRKFSTRIRLNHPDKLGGYGPVGDFVKKLGYLLGVYGVTIIVAALEQTYKLTGQYKGIRLDVSIVTGTALYISISSLILYLTIGNAHTAMVESKKYMLKSLSLHFESRFLATSSSLENIEKNQLKENVEYLEQINKLNHIVASAPEWPITASSLTRYFTSSVIIPVIAGLLSVYLERLLVGP